MVRKRIYGGVLLSTMLFVACSRDVSVNENNMHLTVTPTVSVYSESFTPIEDYETLTPTVVPTNTIAPTETPIPTETPTPELTEIVEEDWISRLKTESEKYIALTHEEAFRVAREVDWLEEPWESPSNMCGPLVGAIMKDAGLLEEDFNLYSLWLPDPDVNGRPWKLFPEDEYTLFRFKDSSISNFDFTEFPLCPGDIIYTYGGSYEHVMIVTEVDDFGRAYSVNNMPIDKGKDSKDEEPIYIVDKLLLFDPNDIEIGVIKNELTTGRFRTGNKGFDLFRNNDRCGIPEGFDEYIVDY